MTSGQQAIGSEAKVLFGRYGRGQFLRDAETLGVNPALAFSHVALRRRRDGLLLVHHPDRGGDPTKAAEINGIYERMVKWLEGDGSRWRAAEQMAAPIEASPKIVPSLRERTAKISAFALAAIAAYAAFRRGGGKRP